MLATTFKDYLAMAHAHGLELDQRVERKQVNGVWGMYANAPIPKGTIIASIPKSELIPAPEGFDYPQEVADKLIPVHSAARQLQEGAGASHYSHVAMFETLEDYKEHSVYFFSDEDMSLLAQMNPLLHRVAVQFRNLIQQVCHDIRSLDPDIQDEHLLRAALNWQNRCWDQYGFLPVLDLFNHSDEKGSELSDFADIDRIGHRTRVDYGTGEQVFISYAPKDMYRHCLCYNYFDETGIHFIDYGLRVMRTITDPFSHALAKKVSEQYPVAAFTISGRTQYQIREPHLFFMDREPNKKLLSFFEKTSYGNLAEIEQSACSKRSIKLTMKATLEALLAANRVEDVALDHLPEKLHRFHSMLTKEKEMLQANLDWVGQY